MKKLFLWMFCITCLSPLLLAKTPDTELRLMSFNIRYINAPGDEGVLQWANRKQPSVHMIQQLSPDVIGFQEPRTVQVKDLIASLNEYDHYELGRDQGLRKDAGEHVMVMWKKDKYTLLKKGAYWLSETPETVSKGWDANNRRVTVWVHLKDNQTGKSFYYFDTHLDHKGDTARLEGSRLNVRRMKKIAGKHGVIFTSGDMNVELHKPNSRLIQPYIDWMRNARMEAPYTDDFATYNGFGKADPMWLDYIFFRNAKPMKYQTIHSGEYGVRYLSDHYPIMCQFEF